MTSIVVDTNVLVSFLIKRDLRQQRLAKDLFDTSARSGCTLVLHQCVVAELVYVLRALYRRPSAEIADRLRRLLVWRGLLPEDHLRWSLVLDGWPRIYSVFTDACLAAVAETGAHDSVATFDKTFARRLQRQGISLYWPISELAAK